MKKTLEIVEKPPYTFLLYPAYRTSILSTRKYTTEWMLSANVIFSCVKTGFDFGVEFVDNPFLKEIDFIYKTKDFSKTIRRIKWCIDRGIYPCLRWNENLVSCRAHNGKKDYNHPVLICGYNMNEKSFDTFGISDRKIFEIKTIAFEEFKKAHQYYKCSTWKFLFWTQKQKYGFNLKSFNKKIEWYVKSCYPIVFRLKNSHDFLNDKCFGIKVYDCLISALEKERIAPSFEINKAFIAYSEHKHILCSAFKYVKENCNMEIDMDFYVNAYIYLEEQFHILRNMQVKAFFYQDMEIIDVMIKKVKSIKEYEQKVLERYLYQVSEIKICG